MYRAEGGQHGKLGAVLLSLSLLAGCGPMAATGSVPYIDIRTANFAGMDDLALCSIFSAHAYRSDEAKDELDRRHVLTPADWQSVVERQLYGGMPECALVAAFGPADQRYLFRDAATGKVLQVEYFYDCVRTRTPDCPYTDVIVVDDKVRSWSTAQSTSLVGTAAVTPAPIPTAVTPTVSPYDDPSYRSGGSGGGGGGGSGGSGM